MPVHEGQQHRKARSCEIVARLSDKSQASQRVRQRRRAVRCMRTGAAKETETEGDGMGEIISGHKVPSNEAQPQGAQKHGGKETYPVAIDESPRTLAAVPGPTSAS